MLMRITSLKLLMLEVCAADVSSAAVCWKSGCRMPLGSRQQGQISIPRAYDICSAECLPSACPKRFWTPLNGPVCENEHLSVLQTFAADSKLQSSNCGQL